MLWLAGRQYLSPPSQQTPFNLVQHLYYYTTLNSWMPQHRDNNNKRDFECAWEANLAMLACRSAYALRTKQLPHSRVASTPQSLNLQLGLAQALASYLIQWTTFSSPIKLSMKLGM